MLMTDDVYGVFYRDDVYASLVLMKVMAMMKVMLPLIFLHTLS
jgi:hypothetical protein